MEAAGSHIEANDDQEVQSHKDSNGCLTPCSPGDGAFPAEGFIAFHADCGKVLGL